MFDKIVFPSDIAQYAKCPRQWWYDRSCFGIVPKPRSWLYSHLLSFEKMFLPKRSARRLALVPLLFFLLCILDPYHKEPLILSFYLLLSCGLAYVLNKVVYEYEWYRYRKSHELLFQRMSTKQDLYASKEDGIAVYLDDIERQSDGSVSPVILVEQPPESYVTEMVMACGVVSVITGMKCNGGVYRSFLGEELHVEFDQILWEEIREQATEMVAEIDDDPLDVSPSVTCNGCKYLNRCEIPKGYV